MAVEFSAGMYRANLKRGVFGNNAKGTPTVDLTIEVVARLEDDQEMSCSPTVRHIYWYGSEKAKDRTQKNLEALGLHTVAENPDGTSELHFGVKSLEAVCEIEEYQGQDRERWNWAEDKPAGLSAANFKEWYGKDLKKQTTAQDMMKKAGAAFKVKTAGMSADKQKAEWLEVVKAYGGGKPQSQLTVQDWIVINDRINNEYSTKGADGLPPLKDDDIPF